jgi:hypothetical protein
VTKFAFYFDFRHILTYFSIFNTFNINLRTHFNIFQHIQHILHKPQDVITEKCDLEQIVFVALIGKDVAATAGREIHAFVHFCGMFREFYSLFVMLFMSTKNS